MNVLGLLLGDDGSRCGVRRDDVGGLGRDDVAEENGLLVLGRGDGRYGRVSRERCCKRRSDECSTRVTNKTYLAARLVLPAYRALPASATSTGCPVGTWRTTENQAVHVKFARVVKSDVTHLNLLRVYAGVQVNVRHQQLPLRVVQLRQVGGILNLLLHQKLRQQRKRSGKMLINSSSF